MKVKCNYWEWGLATRLDTLRLPYVSVLVATQWNSWQEEASIDASTWM